jgi:hypothetical protein
MVALLAEIKALTRAHLSSVGCSFKTMPFFVTVFTVSSASASEDRLRFPELGNALPLTASPRSGHGSSKSFDGFLRFVKTGRPVGETFAFTWPAITYEVDNRG